MDYYDYDAQLKDLQELRRIAAEVKAFQAHNQSNKWKDSLPRHLQHLKKCLKQKTLAVIITLHHTQGLYPFIQFAAKEILSNASLAKKSTQSESQRSSITTISSIVSLIYTYSYQFFLTYVDTRYSELFDKIGKLLQNDLKEEECSLKALLVELVGIDRESISPKDPNFNKRKSLNAFIGTQLLAERPHGPFEEIALNWLKKKAEVLQAQDQAHLCCKIAFQHKATSYYDGQFVENSNQEFKDYRWPLENQSIKMHLTKTIVGFLNTTGGIIYVGIKEDKQKFIEIKGIKLNPQQKIDFLYFLHNDIMKGVYPKEPDRRRHEEEEAKNPGKPTDYSIKIKEEFESAQRKCQYRINKFIHVDFIDIYDKKTYLNSRQDNCSLYIARIKIKIGDSRELYHIINQEKHIPQAFFRQDKFVKKKSLAEFYTSFYERMRNTQPSSEKIEAPHPSCRFNARCNEW